jgi:SPP1 family predicted phage head-tail adaptor
MGLGAGPRDRLVRIEQAMATVDALGGRTLVWLLLETVWAEVVQLSGRELFNAQQLEAKVDTRFRIPWREDVSATDTLRLMYDGKPYNIQRIEEIGRREGLYLYCEARPE